MTRRDYLTSEERYAHAGRTLTEAEAHPSLRTPMPAIVLSDAAADALMPNPPRGWARRTCDNLWWLVAIIWAASVADALTAHLWVTWALVLVLGMATVYMTTVRFDSAKRTDRQVHVFAAGWTVGAALLFAAFAGYAVWVAS